MFIEGDIFKTEGKEYKVRNIVKGIADDDEDMYWLEPVIYRTKSHCITGGENKICHHSDLLNMEYMNATY